jgi:hypothetical protein
MIFVRRDGYLHFTYGKGGSIMFDYTPKLYCELWRAIGSAMGWDELAINRMCYSLITVKDAEHLKLSKEGFVGSSSVLVPYNTRTLLSPSRMEYCSIMDFQKANSGLYKERAALIHGAAHKTLGEMLVYADRAYPIVQTGLWMLVNEKKTDFNIVVTEITRHLANKGEVWTTYGDGTDRPPAVVYNDNNANVMYETNHPSGDTTITCETCFFKGNNTNKHAFSTGVGSVTRALISGQVDIMLPRLNVNDIAIEFRHRLDTVVYTTILTHCTKTQCTRPLGVYPN